MDQTNMTRRPGPARLVLPEAPKPRSLALARPFASRGRTFASAKLCHGVFGDRPAAGRLETEHDPIPPVGGERGAQGVVVAAVGGQGYVLALRSSPCRGPPPHRHRLATSRRMARPTEPLASSPRRGLAFRSRGSLDEADLVR